MDNKDYDFLFDKVVKENIKDSFKDIALSDETKEKIKAEALRKRSFREKVSDLLNYELEIPVGRIGVVAAILALIPTTFTIYEGEKIMDNNVNIEKNIIVDKGN